jgi:hypothetical protein
MHFMRAVFSISLAIFALTAHAGNFESQVVNPDTSGAGKGGEVSNTSRVPGGTAGVGTTKTIVGVGTSTTGTGTTAAPAQTAEQKAAEQQESNALKEAFGQMLSTLAGGAGMTGNRGSAEFAGSGDSGSNYTNNSNGAVLNPTGANQLSGGQPIVGPFQRWFKYCTGDRGFGECKFQNMGIMGDASHRARRSCHNDGQAIDIGALTCGGRTIPTTSDEYFNLAICMASQTQNQLQVIFYRAQGPNMMQKSDHKDHMHVQLKNCKMVYGDNDYENDIFAFEY